MLDNMPELTPYIRRVRGGYLKIQGTWMKYEVSVFTVFGKWAWKCSSIFPDCRGLLQTVCLPVIIA